MKSAKEIFNTKGSAHLMIAMGMTALWNMGADEEILRSHAEELVRLHEEALRDPDGTMLVGPEDMPWNQADADADGAPDEDCGCGQLIETPITIDEQDGYKDAR